MQHNTFFSLAQVIDRQPITVPVETPLYEAIALMHQHGNSCNVVEEEADDAVGSNSSCVLVVEGKRLRGIFTERDLVKLVARRTNTQNATVREMMTENVVTIVDTVDKDIFAALTLLKKHRIRHLPVVDESQNLLGLITAKSIRQQLQPVNLMKWRKVAEVMESEVIHAAPDESIRSIANLMANNQISCVAIAETRSDPETDSLVQPIGIVTERDIVQFQNLELDLELSARDYMSAPLFLVSPEDSLWDIYQQMKQRRVRRLLVKGERGELVGIITQSSLLQVFDPSEMYGTLEVLQRQICQLETEREVLLHERNSRLEQEVQKSSVAIASKNQELQIRLRQQQVIAEIGSFALTAKNLLSISQRVVELVAITLKVEYCKVLELSSNGKELLLKAGVGWHQGVGTAIRVDANSQAAYTLLHSGPVIVDDLNLETRFTETSLLVEHQVVSGMSAIIPDVDRPYGIIEVYTTQHRIFTQNDINFIQAITNIIAQAQERQQAEVLLQESQERYALAVEGTCSGLWDWNVTTNEIFYAPRFKEIIGYLDAELPNVFEAWSTRLHPEDRERVMAALQDHLENRVPYDIEYLLQKKDGDYCWVQARGQAIWNEAGEAVRMAGSITDISDRKRTELNLKQSQQKFRAIFDNTFQFIGLLEPNGNLIEANRTALDFVGLTSEDVRGKPFWTTPWWSMSPEIQAQIKQAISRAARGEFVRFEVEHPGKDRVVTVDFSLTPIKDETGRVVLLIPEGRNINARKQTEAKLQQSNSILQAISSIQTQFLNDAEPKIIFDGLLEHLLELTQSEYGFIGEIHVADDGSRTMEESYMKFRGRPFLKTHAITNIAWNEETRAFYAENAPKGMEFHNLQTLFGAVIVTGEPVIANRPNEDPRRGGLPEGHPPLNAFLGVPFYKNDRMTGMAGIANRPGGYDEDIIEYLKPLLDTCSRIIEADKSDRQRQQAEAKNREQAALLNVATDAIMVRDLENQLLFWNQGAEKIYGWTEAEVLHRNANKLLYQESLAKFGEILRSLYQRGQWQGELQQVTKAGRNIMVESRWTLVKDQGDRPQSILVVNTDITEQKQLEAQFLRTQRLESLGTLAGGIAHDLNNILAPILGFSRLLPLKLPDVDEQTKSFFKIMETNAQRGTALVKQILTFSRGLEGDKCIVQVRHLVNEIAQIINETFPKSIELTLNIPKTLWTVNADANQLHQVLMNLCVNARDSMPDGGKLMIEADNFTVDAEYARLHLDAELGSYVRITVTDTGMGIPPEIIDRIFEPFFTTKEMGRGTGLGLSTVIGIIKSHGGFVDVVSQTTGKKGTRVNIFMPASDATAVIVEEEKSIPKGNGELVLVVDDETPMLEVSKATLETYNYQVITASNGIEAVATYANNQDAIALVIMDVMMPEMDGKTAIRTLKQIDSEVRVIAVSGLITNQEIVNELDQEVMAFLSKPYTNEELLEAVYETVNG